MEHVLTKYHAHEAVIATGPIRENLPVIGDFVSAVGESVLPEQLWSLFIGPVVAPGSTHGLGYATYVSLPDGEDSWWDPELGGAAARTAFVEWIKQVLPDFEVVCLEYGTRAYTDEGRFDAVAEDI